MTPTGFVARFLTALAPVVGKTPTWVHWNRRTYRVKVWTAPFTDGGAEWDLFVYVDDGDGWRWWSPAWHLNEALFAVAPDDLPGEYVRFFAEGRRRGELRRLGPPSDHAS